MNQLPKWVIPENFSLKFDFESSTNTEMVARLYGAMQTLIEEYNLFSVRCKEQLDQFTSSADKNLELFAVDLRQEFQDFIDVIDLKVKSQDNIVNETVNFFKNNLSTSIETIVKDMKESGELGEEILNAIATFDNAIEQIQSNMDTVLGSVSDDLKLLKKELAEADDALKENKETIEQLDLSFENYKQVTNQNFEQVQEQFEENDNDKSNMNTILNLHSSINSGCDSSTMQLIYECFESYLKHSHTDLVYAHAYDNGADGTFEAGNCSAMNYSREVQSNTFANGTGKPINCSSFVNLMLLGVPYELSRYNHNKNVIGGAGYCFNLYEEPLTEENYLDYMWSYSIANGFKEKGLGFKPYKDLSNIREGDVIFWGKDENDLNSVGHVAIVLTRHTFDVTNPTTALFTYIDCRSANKETEFSIAPRNMSYNDYIEGFAGDDGSVSRIIYVGRPTYNTSKDCSPNLIDFNNYNCSSINFKPTNVMNRDVMTVELDWTPTNNLEFIRIRTDSTGVGDCEPSINDGTSLTKHVVLPFVVFSDGTQVENVYIEVRQWTDESRTSSNAVSTLNMKNIRLYKGVKCGYISPMNETFFHATMVLPNNTDLNNLDVGKYHCESGGSAQSMSNAPTTFNFVLYCMYRTSGSLTQFLIDANNYFYMRAKTTAGWGKWKKYSGTDMS